MKSWIDINELVELSKKYEKQQRTTKSLRIISEKIGAFRKGKDGYHIEFNAKKMKRYFELNNEYTLSKVAADLNINPGSLKYLMLKNNIQYNIKLGKKIINKENVEKIKNIIKDKNGI